MSATTAAAPLGTALTLDDIDQIAFELKPTEAIAALKRDVKIAQLGSELADTSNIPPRAAATAWKQHHDKLEGVARVGHSPDHNSAHYRAQTR